MKSSLKFLAPVLLLGGLPLLAVDVDHADLYNRTNRIVRELIDQDGLPVTVIWTCPPVKVVNNQPVQPKYELEIIRDPAADASKPYSLYNLGLQGRHWEVTINEITGRQVTVMRQRYATLIPPTTGVSVSVNQEVDRVHPRRPPPSQDQPNPPPTQFDRDRICYLQFAGSSCRITVTSSRPLGVAGNLHSSGQKSNHDTVPPPAEPGGNDGDVVD